MVNEEAEVKISRSRISLQRSQPFFSFLSLFLKPRELKECPTMAVDIDGNLYYNPDFVNSLNDNEMTSIICHEVLHLSLMHLTRGQKFNRQIGNVSADICVNEILKDNNFNLPKGSIWSNNEREVKLFNKTIKKCNEKVFEEIYWELYEEAKNQLKQAIKKGEKIQVTDEQGEGIELDKEDLEGYEIDGSSNDGSGKIKNIDSHISSKKNGKELNKEEREAKEREWINRTIEASQISRMAGKEPNGLQRIIGKLFESKTNWRQLLARYVQNTIPHDFAWNIPSKKSISCGVYLPSVTREKVNVSIIIDVSGSIGQEELTSFLSEVVSLARAYREKISMKLYTHETEISEEYNVENGSVSKILAMKIRGGGGTSHQQVFQRLNEKANNNKLCIFLTDGFSDLDSIDFKKNRFDSIFFISKNGSEEQLKGKNVKIIKLDR